MTTGTRIRTLARHLDASAATLWVIDSQGLMIYLSSGASRWLALEDASRMLGRRCLAGTPASEDPLDRLAASLSPPPGLLDRGWMTRRVNPHSIDGREIPGLEVGFIRLDSPTEPLVLAVAGEFSVMPVAEELSDAVQVRAELDLWRQAHAHSATIATAGISSAARRTRARLQVAGSVRTHLSLVGPRGCGAESIARRIHQRSAGEEPLVVIDGPLMDAELLDAVVSPVIHRLSESKTSVASALVRDLEETPFEAQQRLSELLATYGARLRILASLRDAPRELNEPKEEIADDDGVANAAMGVHPKLLDAISSLSITLTPLASRVEDIPLIAAALLDARHAEGEGPGERLSRQAIDALVIYPWPGDFEELEGAIRHAIRAAPHTVVGIEHLPLAIRSYRPGEPPTAPRRPPLSLDDALRRYERHLIREAIQEAGGNRAEAARRLGISRAKLIRRLDDAPGT